MPESAISEEGETISTVPSTSMSSMVEMRRVNSMPEQLGIETVASGDPLPLDEDEIRHSKSDGYVASSNKRKLREQHQIDRFGFIQNLDRFGNFLKPEESRIDPIAPKGETPGVLHEGRVKKWQVMLSTWDRTVKRRPKLVLKRLRKGVPHTIRSDVWLALAGVRSKMEAHRGTYERLVRDATVGISYAGNGTNEGQSRSHRLVQDTIERDIHRTFPRHTMFYDSDSDHDESEHNQPIAPAVTGLCGAEGIASIIRDLDLSGSGPPATKSTVQNDGSSSELPEGRGGQASLRRVLKAYSLYDKEVGYCQGMNFITGMFLTIMSEEEAFWMLVAIMHDEPCKMRGLFGEGMQETHMVLHVAEKLVHHFLPKLAKHLDREHIHVTMYATQWLLTQYTSNFRFDLVLRVWDCYLMEGWKITYRVMISILQHFQADLLRSTFEDILAFMRDLPEKVQGDVIVDAAFKIPLRRKHVAKYENDWRTQQKHKK